MSEPAPTAPLRGLFDRATKGLSFAPVTVQVERGRVRFFAQVLGAIDPVHTDLAAAREEGHPDLVAPPAFFMAIEAMANDELRCAGATPVLDRIGCDYRYLLHGDERYDYDAPLFAGDEVTLTTTVLDFYDKKGGLMEFVTISSTVEHAKRGVLIRAVGTLLHRLG